MSGKKCWVDSPGGFCLYCEQLRHKSVPSFSWFLPGTILSCRDPLWGSRGWYIPYCHMYVPKRAILAPLTLPEALDSDGVAPCHHILFISHQQHTFIYCLLCTILSPKFMYQALCTKWAFPLAQAVKNMPATKEMQVWFLNQKDPLEEEMATHSSILAWRIPWTEAPSCWGKPVEK